MKSTEVRVELSTTLRLMGDVDAALTALDVDENQSQFLTLNQINQSLDDEQINLQLHKSLLLYSEERHDEFLKLILPLLISSFLQTRGLKPGRAFKLLTIPGLSNLMGAIEFIDLVLKVVKLLAETLSRYSDALSIVQSFLKVGSNFLSKQVQDNLRFLVISYVFKASNHAIAYNALRDILTTSPFSITLHMLLSIVVTKLNTRELQMHQKFLTRHSRSPRQVAFQISLGLHYLASGRNLIALERLVPAFVQTAIPFLLVPIASACIGVARHKNTPDKSRMSLIFAGHAFLTNYEDLMAGVSESKYREALFNHGRLFHSVSLTSLAIRYYKQVLEGFELSQSPQGLVREAAFNLARIYVERGCDAAAMEVYNTYLII
ncbi:hypothetical protein GEMRC1_007614 [Eukaryota sp. GEM-RC1]